MQMSNMQMSIVYLIFAVLCSAGDMLCDDDMICDDVLCGAGDLLVICCAVLCGAGDMLMICTEGEGKVGR